MVQGRVVFSPLFYLQCILMVCWKNCQSQVLVAFGVTCLLVLSAMVLFVTQSCNKPPARFLDEFSV